MLLSGLGLRNYSIILGLAVCGGQWSGSASAADRTLQISAPPAYYITLQERQAQQAETEGRPIAFKVTKDGVEVARSNGKHPGALLPPGDYDLQVAKYPSISIALEPPADLSPDADIFSVPEKPSWPSHWEVSPKNANFYLRVSDGRLTRFYNSRSLINHSFGFGWTFDYSTELRRIPGGGFEVNEPSGYMNRYDEEGARIDLEPTYDSKLIEDVNRVIRRFDSYSCLECLGRPITVDSFDSRGRLRMVQYATGEAHELRYKGDFLQSVVDQQSGDVLYDFKSKAAGRIDAMKDPTGRRFQYNYDDHGNLIEVTGPEGATIRHQYDDWRNLVRITYPDKSWLGLEYDVDKDWVTRIQGPDIDDQFEYGSSKESPDHYWTLKTDLVKNLTRWDYLEDREIVLKTTAERLDVKLSRLLARLGLREVKAPFKVQSMSGDALLKLAEQELLPLGKQALEAIQKALHSATHIHRTDLKRILVALEYVRRSEPELAQQAGVVFEEVRNRFFDKEARPSLILRLDALGHEVARYPFQGSFAAGSLSLLDSGRVVVGDLEPFNYLVLNLNDRSFTPADEVASKKAGKKESQADLPEEWKWDTAEYEFLLYLKNNWSLFLAMPKKPYRLQRGYTVHLSEFGAARPEIGIRTSEALVLAARRPDFPVLSIALADGEVHRLGEGPVLTLIRFKSDVWGLYPDRVVRYRDGQKLDLEIPLPKGLGTPQGFTPLGDETFLVSFLRE